MPTRRLLARILIGLALLCGLVLALASSVVLHGLTVVVVVIAALIVGCVTFGMRDDGRAAALAAAWKAAGATVAVILVFAGGVVLGGGLGAAAVTLVVAAAAGVALLRPVLRARRANSGGGAPAGRAASAAAPTGWADLSPAPVLFLPTSGLAREWARTTAVLATPLEPRTRQSVVRRREEVLDEMERRDPEGFARWLAAAATADSDPVGFLHDGRTPGAGTD